jgi:hypothetical protein
MDREDDDEDRRTTKRIAAVAAGSMWCALFRDGSRFLWSKIS